MPKHRWTYVKRKAMVFQAVQDLQVFTLFMLITLGEWVVSWKLHPFFATRLWPCVSIFWFFFFFNGMFTVSLLFRNILFCLENFHCLKNVSQSKDKKRVIGGYHKAWSMTKCLLHCSSTVINMNGYFAFRQVKIEKKINIIYFDNVAKTGCYPSCIGTF